MSDVHGASAAAREALTEVLDQVLADGADGGRIADDLFGVAAVLATEAALRRILTDPSVAGEAKSGLVRQVFGGRLDDASLRVVGAATDRRWAATRDLGDVLEHLGVVAVVKTADGAGEGDRLEDELFAFGRVVADNAELRDALSDPARSAEDKRGLLRSLLEGKAGAGTIRLAEQAADGTHRTVSVAIEEYQKIAAAVRQRLVALVRVARPLPGGDHQRLADVLSRQYGRPVHLNEVVDPRVIGGVRVEIGHDVIDGTVASRLDEARRKLAG